MLASRLEKVKEEHSKCELIHGNLKRESLNLDRKSNALKMDLLKLAKQTDQYKNTLLSRGLSADIDQSEPSQVPQPVSVSLVYYGVLKIR